MRTMALECLPGDVIEELELDVTALDIGDTLRVRDVPVDTSKFKLLDDLDQVIVAAAAPRLKRSRRRPKRARKDRPGRKQRRRRRKRKQQEGLGGEREEVGGRTGRSARQNWWWGLGESRAAYAQTRHNAGWAVLTSSPAPCRSSALLAPPGADRLGHRWRARAPLLLDKLLTYMNRAERCCWARCACKNSDRAVDGLPW